MNKTTFDRILRMKEQGGNDKVIKDAVNRAKQIHELELENARIKLEIKRLKRLNK